MKTTKEEQLNLIIHDHLMSMDFDAHSDECTPTERALFFRMKDVAFAYSDLTNAKLVESLEYLRSCYDLELLNKAKLVEENERLMHKLNELEVAYLECKLLLNERQS